MTDVAFLIDADNLSPAAMELAFADLRGRGWNVTVLRAYGSAETLGNARDFLQRRAARAIVNQGRGTTDAALVVDAMDLLHAGVLPARVAIGSSDGDFAPLVVRLREAGRQVTCYAQGHKAPLDDLARVYGEVVDLGGSGSGGGGGAAPAPAPARARKSAAAKSPARKSPAPAAREARPPSAAQAPVPAATRGSRTSAAAPEPAAAPAPAARKAAGKRAAKAVAPAVDDSVALARDVLERIPGFAEGQVLELNTVVKALRDAKAMSKSASASSFFSKLGLPVELTPARQPNKIRLRLDD